MGRTAIKQQQKQVTERAAMAAKKHRQLHQRKKGGGEAEDGGVTFHSASNSDSFCNLVNASRLDTVHLQFAYYE